MIIWGSGGDVRNFSSHGEKHHCEICNTERDFILQLRYRYAHLYYIFGWVTDKSYHLLCNMCGRGWKVNTKQAEERIKINPIPFNQRKGWIFLVGLVVLFIAALVAQQAQQA